MSAVRRHKRHHHEEHENHERWLVSGYDMMTLLFAVFVVLFAISSTNISKVKVLQQSLQEAFSGPVLTGGKAMMQTGATSESQQSSASPPVQSMTPSEAVSQAMQADSPSRATSADAADAAGREQEDFLALKQRIDRLAEEAGIADKVQTTVARRGLQVRLMTDRLFFDSG